MISAFLYQIKMSVSKGSVSPICVFNAVQYFFRSISLFPLKQNFPKRGLSNSKKVHPNSLRTQSEDWVYCSSPGSPERRD